MVFTVQMNRKGETNCLVFFNKVCIAFIICCSEFFIDFSSAVLLLLLYISTYKLTVVGGCEILMC